MLVLLLALGPADATAQRSSGPGPASPERDRGWFAYGLGLGEPYRFAGAATANFGRTRVLQIGLHATSDLGFGGRTAHVTALHVGRGWSRVGRWDRTALAVGPAVVWGLRDAADPDSRYGTPGVVVSGQAIFTPVRELGLGLDAFVNLNLVRPAYGVVLTLVFEGNK